MGCCCFSNPSVNSRSNSIQDPALMIKRKLFMENKGQFSNSNHFQRSYYFELPFYNDFSKKFNDLCLQDSRFWVKNIKLLNKISIFLNTILVKSDLFLSEPSFLNLESLLKQKVPLRPKKKRESDNNSIIIEENEDNYESSISSEPEKIEHKFSDPENTLKNMSIFRIEIEDLKFQNNLIEKLNLELPFIQLEISLDGSRRSQVLTVFNTKKVNAENLTIWNEFFEKKFENLEFRKACFAIRLLYFDGKMQGCMQLCDDFVFSFEELEDMKIIHKTLIFKDKLENFIAELKVTCQLVWDFEKLVWKWREDFCLKKEILSRIEIKISGENRDDGVKNEEHKESSIFSMEDSKSLGQSLYDNPYFVK